MKKFFFFFLIIIFLASNLAINANAIRVSSDQLTRTLNFKLGDFHDFTYAVTNNQQSTQDFKVGLSADNDRARKLLPFMRIEPEILPGVISGDQQAFHVIMEFTEEVDSYGQNLIYLTVQDSVSDSGSQIGGMGGTILRIHVMVLYPGYMIQGSMKIDNVNENEPIKPVVSVYNIGESPIQQLYAEISFYDAENNFLGKSKTQIESLDSFKSTYLTANFIPDNLPSGAYSAQAVIYYDNNEQIVNSTFEIGTMNVDYVSSTEQAVVGKINPYIITVKSTWNGNLDNVYAIINAEGQQQQTPSISLNAFQKRDLNAFLDFTNLNETKNITASIEIHYEGESKTVNAPLALVKEVLPGTEQGFRFNSTDILLAVLILVIIIFIIMFLFYMKKNKKSNLDYLLK